MQSTISMVEPIPIGDLEDRVHSVPPTNAMIAQRLPMEIELSVVIPCLNEADTIAGCIERARRALDDNQINGEIVVADNGSTDSSAEISNEMGARVVSVAEPGYGNALMGGISESRGRFVVMGDADGSYDFLELPKFVEQLRRGFDLVQGCRLPSGGGMILPGAMPALHRWLGNPLFSALARRWFAAPIHDIYCGMRAFRKEAYEQLNQRCTGMEFATEMIINASRRGLRISEVPITLSPDGRRAHAPHLKTFRDGWRTLRFFLIYCPRWLFLIPGMMLIMLGLLGYGLALPGVTVHGITFDAHTLLFASLAVLCGYEAILFAIFAKSFAIAEGLIPEDPRLCRFLNHISVERGLIAALAALIAGAVLLVEAVEQWRSVGYGHLNYAVTMRWVIPGTMLTALGFQTVLSSFVVTILKLRRQ
jgi:glycosyltransferase involved in cell wall biosynthesis